MISLGLCLSLSLKLENVSTKLRSVRSVPHLLPLFVMYHRRWFVAKKTSEKLKKYIPKRFYHGNDLFTKSPAYSSANI
jgi:hypothetical protein